MTAEDKRTLALLERGHADAKIALAELKASWRREDEATAEARKMILAKHEQGTRDRDAVCMRLGGESLIEADERAAREAAATRLAAADAEAKRLAEARREAEATEKAAADLQAVNVKAAEAARAAEAKAPAAAQAPAPKPVDVPK